MRDDEPNFYGVGLDKTSIAQELLDIDKKQRSNLFPWNGQFSPQLIEVLLRVFAPKRGLVLDPFAGSGTVLREAGSLGLSAVGAEINPAACKMAQIYCLMGLPVATRKVLMNRLANSLLEALPDQEPSLFGEGRGDSNGDVKTSLVELHGRSSDEATRSVLEALIVLADFYKDLTSSNIFDIWAKLKATILGLPESNARATLLNCDARKLPLRDGEADFVLTSPPYINVFNYHQQYRRSAEALGWNLLAVARSEIGSNRKHRQNRFLTVVQYCLDMTHAMKELQRVCRDGARVVAIVGRESNVRKTRFFNGELVAALATRCAGWRFESRQERVFVNRFGERIVEDILHFDVRKNAIAAGEEACTIAIEALTQARGRTPNESLADLTEAQGLAGQVKPSPIYDAAAARSSSAACARTIRT